MAYWLMKSEPHVYSIDEFKKDKRTCWNGVRNYQARNMMRDDMKKGDQVLFYHSSCKEPGVAGIAKVVREGYPDPTNHKGKGKNKGAKKAANKDPDNPTWFMVDIQYQRKMKHIISLTEIKAETELVDMQLVRRGNRLSVMPVSKQEFEHILSLE